MQNVEQFIQEARKFFYVRRGKHKRVSRTAVEQTAYGAWTKLGDGYYGEAWAHDDIPELVLKISGPSGWGYCWKGAPYATSADAGPRADVWPDFAEACMLHPHMNLPEIMHLERVGGFAWGVMPRYVEARRRALFKSGARISGRCTWFMRCGALDAATAGDCPPTQRNA